MPFAIRTISAETAHLVRHPVLRTGRPPETAILECDALPETAHFGAFDGDRLMAVATVHPDPCPGRGGLPAWRLRGMATLEPFRGRGAGRALIDRSLAHARDRGGRLFWCNGRLGARGFYERIGFVVEGDSFELPPNGPHLVFVLDLSPARPLLRRPADAVLVAFFAVNFFFITYMIDIEQIVIPDPARFAYPLWPPRFAVDMSHWWARSFDPLVFARPSWYRATIWIDSLVFGPFYLAAMVAFWKGRNWIRTPALVWAGMMIAIVSIILFEEMAGPFATPHPARVLLANGPWLLFPFAVVWRLRHDDPFGPSPHPQPHDPS